MDKPIYIGFAVLQLSKLHLYELLYNKLEPYFEKDKTQIHHMDFDSFVLSIKTQNIIIGLKNLEDLFFFVIWMKIMNYSVKENKKFCVNPKPKHLKAIIYMNSLL